MVSLAWLAACGGDAPTPPSDLPPEAVALRVAESGPLEVSLEWEGSSAADFLRYEVWRHTGSADGLFADSFVVAMVTKADETQLRDSTVVPRRTYRYSIRVRDDASQASEVQSAAAETPPPSVAMVGFEPRHLRVFEGDEAVLGLWIEGCEGLGALAGEFALTPSLEFRRCEAGDFPAAPRLFLCQPGAAGASLAVLAEIPANPGFGTLASLGMQARSAGAGYVGWTDAPRVETGEGRPLLDGPLLTLPAWVEVIAR